MCEVSFFLNFAYVISMALWIGGLVYLPMIFYYHTKVAIDSEPHLIFCRMEENLVKKLVTPAMICSFIAGILLVCLDDIGIYPLFIRLIFLLSFLGLHIYLFNCKQSFKAGTNKKSGFYYKYLSELMVVFAIASIMLIACCPI